MFGGYGLDSSGSGRGSVAASNEHGNEPSVSINGGEFLDYLETISFQIKTLLHEVSYLLRSVQN
jgi:hypothetical protein